MSKLWFTLALALLPLAPASAALRQEEQGEEPIVDNRKEIKELVDQLVNHADEKGRQDSEAIGVIDKLLQEWPKTGPKDRDAVTQGLDRCFKVKRQETAEGVPDNKLYIAAAAALGRMGPESVKVLLTWIGDKSHKKDLPLQERLIQSLGKTKDERGRQRLLKLLDDHQPRIVAVSAEALGQFDAVDQKLRKETFEDLLKLMMESKNAYDANTSDPIESERYNTIVAPIISSLQRLSKHEEHDPQKWQHWWNKNKKEDWDKSES